MILECKSCQKKFIVPDNAITNAGRLVQCSSCGNKWTQYPVIQNTVQEEVNYQTKKEINKKPKRVAPKVNEVKIFSNQISKKRKVKKKTGPSIYSKEYLEKKHGIKIDGTNSKILKDKAEKKSSSSYFGFYTYLTILIITVLMLIGILNLTKNIIILKLPFTEIYIEYLFENLDNFIILFRDALNLY